MANNLFPLEFGPTGRHLSVDTDGKLVATNESAINTYIYGYGTTGRPLVIDGSGRLVLSQLSTITASGASPSASTSASGVSEPLVLAAQLPQSVWTINGLSKLNNKLYIGTKNWFGSSSRAVYSISCDTDGNVSYAEAFTLASNSGWPAVLETYKGALYTGPMEGAVSGWLFKYDGTSLSLVGSISGHNPDVGQQAKTFFGMCKHDNKLIITIADNIFNGPHPVFYYDGNEFGEFYRETTIAPQWGWIRNPLSYNGSLYSFQTVSNYLNIFDGIRHINCSTGSNTIGKGAAYKGKLYLFGIGVYEWNETSLSPSQIYNTANPCDYPFIYNGYLYFTETTTNNIIRFDGNSFATIGTVDAGVTGINEIDGRLIIVCTNGKIYKMRDDVASSLSHGQDDFESHSAYFHKEYTKKILNFIGSKYQYIDPFGTLRSTGFDVDNYPNYTSTNIISQNDPLSSGITKLDTKLGAVSIPPSGWNLPASSNFGDYFYHLESGYFRKGENTWERETTDLAHNAVLWTDTTPLPGESLSLPTANTFYRYISSSPSGGQVHGHGLLVHSSGILIQDDESAGHYHISYGISFNGTVNTNYYGAIFVNDTEHRSTKFSRKIGAGGDVGNAGGQSIIALYSQDDINIRFAADGNSKNIGIQTLNITINRIHKH